MGTEERDASKVLNWKSIGDPISSESSEGAAVKKRLPKKIRQIPDYYFLPRRSRPSAILFYGTWIAAGIGAGMLTEIWINKKVEGMAFALHYLIQSDALIDVVQNIYISFSRVADKFYPTIKILCSHRKGAWCTIDSV